VRESTPEETVKRIEAYAVGILLALVPAVFGLWGSASFSKVVPVRVPDQARATVAIAGVDTRQAQTAYRAGRTPAERDNGRHGADDVATHDAGDDQGADPAGPRTGDLGGSGEGERGDDRVDSSGSSGSGPGSGDNSGHRSGGGDDSGGDSTGSGKAESGDIRVDTSGRSGNGHGSD
jgi:hypothetical protein